MRPFHGNRRVRRAYKADRIRELRSQLIGIAADPTQVAPSRPGGRETPECFESLTYDQLEAATERVPTEVPWVKKPVSIKARYWWHDGVYEEEDSRVTLRGGNVIFLGNLEYRPLSAVVEGKRIFDALYGDSFIFMAEEDWQRLLKKAQKEA